MEFPELVKSKLDVAGDVCVEISKADFHHPSINTCLPFAFSGDEKAFLIYVKGVAAYEVMFGKKIIIYPMVSALASDIRIYCLSNAFAALLHQINILPLHAGSICMHNKAVLIMGDSGVGKSTLLFGLKKRGYPIFSDDVVVVHSAKSTKVCIRSSYPMMKLWSHQMEAFGLDKQFQVRSGVDKYPYYFHDHFDTSSRSVDMVVVLKTSPDIKRCTYREMSGAGAILLVAKHIYRKEFMFRQSIIASFSKLFNLLQNSICIEITRPADQNSENELIELFISLLGEKNFVLKENSR